MPKQPSPDDKTLQGLVRDRPRVGYTTFFDLDTLTTIPLLALPWVMFAVAFILTITGLGALSGMFTWGLAVLFVSLFVMSLSTMALADWHKRGVSKGKTIAQTGLTFMLPNSTQVQGGYTHSLVIEDHAHVTAEAPVKQIVDAVFTRDPDLATAAMQEIMSRIAKRLPILPNGKRYELVRWMFPDAPFPDLVKNEKGQYVRGDRGTPLNRTLLVLAHEDYCLPAEAFDYYPDKVRTFYANYESEEAARMGILDLWEFYEGTQEWIATVGLGPEHRTTLQQVRPDDKVREYANIVEYLRSIPTQQGSETLSTMRLQALDELVRTGQVWKAEQTGLQGLNPGYQKTTLSDQLKPYRWVIVVVLLLVIAFIVFGRR